MTRTIMGGQGPNDPQMGVPERPDSQAQTVETLAREGPLVLHGDRDSVPDLGRVLEVVVAVAGVNTVNAPEPHTGKWF